MFAATREQRNRRTKVNNQSFEEPSQLLSERQRDRKSTRLNSSHGYISYAVFCLAKKTDSDHPHTSSCHSASANAVVPGPGSRLSRRGRHSGSPWSPHNGNC